MKKRRLSSKVYFRVTIAACFLGMHFVTAQEAPKKADTAKAKNIDEVVVVGYTSRKKKNVTSAISTINAKEITQSPVANLSNVIAGRLPGVVTTQRWGEPGSDGTGVSIRGFGDALVVVDGVPQPYTQLDPNDVESFTVLKDAAAAVYGVRAANGVILITTKSGSRGRPTIDYSMYYGVQSPTRYPKMVSAADFILLTDEGEINKGGQPAYGKNVYEDYLSGRKKSYDWIALAIRPDSPQQQHNITVNGGSDRIKYLMSVGYLEQNGMWRSGDTMFQRYNFRTKVEGKVTDHLSVGMNVSGRIEQRDSPGSSTENMIGGLLRTFPTQSPYANDNPEYPGTTNQSHQNVIALMQKSISGYTNDTNNFFNGILNFTYNAPFLEGLYLSGQYSYIKRYRQIKTWRPTFTLYNYNEATGVYAPGYIGNSPTSLRHDFVEETDRVSNLSLGYKKKFNDQHNVEALLVFEERANKGNNFWASREFLLDSKDYLFAGVDNNKNNNGSAFDFASRSLVGRAYYDFKNKYIIDFIFRYDGSSRFPANSRWGFFPAVSAGWRASDEAFFSNLGLKKFITDLKFRGSWGKVGDDGWNDVNNRNATSWQFVPGYTYPSGNYIFGDAVIPGLSDKGLINPNITWFTSTTTNIGLEMNILKGLFTIEADYFFRKRSGLFATRAVSIPSTFGASLPQENINIDNNRGFEFVLGHHKKYGGVDIDVRGNVSFTRSQWEYQERAPFNNSQEQWRNDSTNRWKNIWWGYKTAGQFQSQEDINNWAVQDGQGNRTLRPGDIKYEDVNGDGIIDDKDVRVIGRGESPEIMFGLNLNVNWKGFDFSVLFQGAANFNQYFSNEYQNPLYNGANSLDMFMDRWHRQDPYDPTSPWVPGKFPATWPTGSPNNQKTSDFWLKDASYVRLKNIQLGYTFKGGMLESIGVKKLRVYLNGFNLFTWDKVKYMDPENNSSRGLYYPQQRVINFGLNATL
ncbi:hypothetical protein FF18_07595 [Elizabethkingia anophelis]|uniref:SusC/RagA family TonB-linked outer membrane protein n=1 Tax=Elizabethkingia anophelis TaxID=1117645 RepID=UPI0004E30D31|nr:TonB-dependent receptor [Elizabethkingia anophelis]KFC34539.1 hypothetical protein FF18_07595 [Elizabethkingia anophelis]MDV3499975.1 TonB-dependent receptor [Elizabethkingia anophelis]